MKTKLVLAICGLLMLTGSVWMQAQGLFGSISGVVTDSSGALIANAAVTVTNIETNVTSQWKTNSAGVYHATSLNPGSYRIEAKANGFKTTVANQITLEVNVNAKVDFVLNLGGDQRNRAGYG